MITRRTLNAITIGFIIFILYLVSLVITAGHAEAHEGDHPLSCSEVEWGTYDDCYEPGTFEADEADVTYHQFHPLCIVEREGQGSAAARPVFVRCLPETGAEHSLLAIFGGMALAGGAATLILGGKRQAIRDGMKDEG